MTEEERIGALRAESYARELRTAQGIVLSGFRHDLWRERAGFVYRRLDHDGRPLEPLAGVRVAAAISVARIYRRGRGSMRSAGPYLLGKGCVTYGRMPAGDGFWR